MVTAENWIEKMKESGYRQDWIAKKIGINNTNLSKAKHGSRKLSQKYIDQLNEILKV